jgi:hypothetical protein
MGLEQAVGADAAAANDVEGIAGPAVRVFVDVEDVQVVRIHAVAPASAHKTICTIVSHMSSALFLYKKRTGICAFEGHAAQLEPNEY